ncbi:PTS system mannose/fructose/sorbose family transporter subunit IID [Virgibacillus proomii]|nr:PTS system mannose/fructose/sorbose family transporter subunit IID [Virgibacillus proomii]
MKRQWELFNTHPFMAAPIIGVTAARKNRRKKRSN